MNINSTEASCINSLSTLIVLLVAIYSVGLQADESQDNAIPHESHSNSEGKTGQVSAQRVFIDPDTGERRLPNVNELLELPTDLLEGIFGMPAEDQLVTGEDGTMILRHGSSQINFSQMHLHEDGTVSSTCSKPHDEELAQTSEHQQVEE